MMGFELTQRLLAHEEPDPLECIREVATPAPACCRVNRNVTHDRPTCGN